MKEIQIVLLLLCIIGPLITQGEIKIDQSGCGKTKGCFLLENYIVTYKKAGDSIEFEMSGENEWVAVGFNSERKMPDTDAVICATISGEVKIQHYDITARSLPPKTDPTPSIISLINGTYSNGRTSCRFKRKIDASGQGQLKSLNTSHYLVVAYGPVSESKPGHHNWRGLSDVKVDLQYIGPLITQGEIKIDQSGCGKTKGCFLLENYIVTYKKAGDSIEFEMSGENKWVAVGFNSQRKMPDTDAVICATISGEVKIQHYDITARSLPPKTDPTPSIISLINGTYSNGRTSCRFKRKIDASGQGQLKSLNTSHYLVVAYGPVSESKPGHHNWRGLSDVKVDLQNASNITGRSSSGIPKLIKAHGSLLSISWLGFAAVAIFMARYMRLVWEDEKLLGQKVWFTVHRGLMIAVIIFSIIGVIFAFVHRKGWSEGIGAHPYTGIITLVLALIQPIMAFFRPHPGTDKRFIFNWAHRSVGLSAFILAVVTLFLAVFIEYLKLKDTGLFVLVAFCLGVVIVLIFEIIFFCIHQASIEQGSLQTSDNKGGKIEQMQEVQPQPSLSSSGKFLRLFLFGFVVLVAVVTSLAFVIVLLLKETAD